MATTTTAHRLTPLQAIGLNMSMMVGVGPFVTIPLFFATMGGPQALVGWIAGAIVAVCDGLVWCELAAAFPGSGGTYHFYDRIYRGSRFGRLLKFLFIWQFLISGPMELASGGIGLGQYVGYLFPSLEGSAVTIPLGEGDVAWSLGKGQVVAVLLIAGLVGLAYRRIELAGRLVLVLWVGMLVLMAWMIGTGLIVFDPNVAFDWPDGAWRLDDKFALGLGAAMAIAMYDFLGYYQICYLGDEVVDPPRTLPRAVLVSVIAVAALYLGLSLSILGTMPWQDVIVSTHIASDFMDRRLGPTAATAVTAMILWSGGAGLFSGLLGYSRVPYAAAIAGDFYRGLAHTHPRGGFPDRSLLLIGGLTAAACLLDLSLVIAALLTTRIVVQFLGQIGTLLYVHSRTELREQLRFRMWLYPIPLAVAAGGWTWILATTEPRLLIFGSLCLGLGIAAFAIRERVQETDRHSTGRDAS